MKHNIYITVLFALFLFCQCAIPTYNLVEHKRYSDEILTEHTIYQYHNNNLINQISIYLNKYQQDSAYFSFSVYEAMIKDSGTDSIEIVYGTWLPGEKFDTTKIVKEYDTNGVKRVMSIYNRDNGLWTLFENELYDSNGSLTYKWYDYYNSSYTYDSQGHCSGRRTSTYSIDSLGEKAVLVNVDTIIYSDDGQKAYWYHNQNVNKNSPETELRETIDMDRHGRIKCRQFGISQNRTDQSIMSNRVLYKYGRAGKIKKIVDYTYDDFQTKYRRDSQYRYRYRRGFIIKEKYMDIDDRVSGYVKQYNYNRRSGLLTEQILYNLKGEIINREEWVYEKSKGNVPK